MAGEAILIIEDNPTNLKLEQLLLTLDGYDVQTAIDAVHAFKVLETFHPRLILMDLQLPVTNGYSLSEQLKSNAKYQDIIIVALTAYAMKGDEEKARAAGCDGYMTKPISAATFSTDVANYIAKGI